MKTVFALGIVGVGILLYLMAAPPQDTRTPTVSQPVAKSVVQTSVSEPAAPETVATPDAELPIERSPVTRSARVDVPPIDVEPEAPPETGPFEVSLGQHTIHFARDRGQAMQFRLVVTVPDQTVRSIVLRKKEQLIRALYFHGSRRRADSMDESGKVRLIDYVEPIYHRMLKKDNIELEMRDFERVTVTFPDAESP